MIGARNATLAPLALASLALAALGCDGFTPAVDHRFERAETEAIWVEVPLDGSGVRVGSQNGATEVRGLQVAAELELDGVRQLTTTSGRRWSCESSDLPAGDSRIECDAMLDGELAVTLALELSHEAPYRLGWSTRFRNAGDSSVTVRKLVPFRAAADDGGAVLLGSSPDQVRILQNGRDELIDFSVDLLRGDAPLSDPDGIPVLMPYSSFSNGMAIAHDLASGHSLLAGFTELDWATPLVAFAGDLDVAVPIADRVPMTELLAEARYPTPVELGAAEDVSGGEALFYFDLPSPFAALETYGDELGHHHDIALPARPQAGWDSWYTSFQHTDIDATFVRSNADGLAELFGPYGISSQQLDLGWQDRWGDWNGSAGFPDGMADIAAYLAALDIAPELWMAPLSAEEGSALYQAHRDQWFVDKNAWGEALMDPDMHPLDLTRDDVIEHVRALGERVRQWGYTSVKMDFAYYILVSIFPPDPHVTPTTLLRRAVSAFRDGVGDDVTFINIAAGFPNIGLVDSLRIGIDVWPCWDGGADCAEYGGATGIGVQGVKPAVLTTARRYWLNGRVWWNHLDQLFFRDLSADESRSWATLVSLAGGMIALGEDTSTLAPEQIDTFRRILPLLGLTARPTDLFRTEYPEVWHLALPDTSARQHLIGLFHWGTNRDLRAHPPSRRDDGSAVRHDVDLAALGLDGQSDYLAYAFWQQRVLGSVRGTLSHELQPHNSEVIKLVPRPTVPAYLATNRHVTMGPAFVADVSYADERLRGSVRTTPGFDQTLVFWLPDGFELSSATIEGLPPISAELRDGNTLVLTFTGLDAHSHGFELAFH